MVALWITIGLIISTVCVSVLGAAFSVIGIGALFSGAILAVWAMASSLELSKFVLAAYVHQRWPYLNVIYRSYLVFAIVVLSMITSMGIFGFLSDAYQSASTAIETETIKLEAEKAKKQGYLNEIARINKSIDEIPATRITKKMKARQEAEPAIALLNKQSEDIDKLITDGTLRMVEIKKKVGPLMYISRAFKMDIDDVVKYLILVFVSVFDPLAICLVIAMSQAIESRRNPQVTTAKNSQPQPQPQQQQVQPAASPETTAETSQTPAQHHTPDADEAILMRFVDEKKDKNVV